MKVIQCLKSAGIGLATATLVACSGSGSGSSDGTLTLALSDGPVDDVAEIWVQFRGIRLQPQSGPAIDIPFTTPLSVDMLTLTEGNTASLLSSETVPGGVYNWMELQVNAEFDGVFDSYVITNLGGQEEIRVPSGSQTGLRLVSPFTITANQATSFLIDWDMRMGLVDAPGQAGYTLRPAFRIIDMTQYGTLSGTVAIALVTDASCTNDLNADTGNVVYIYDQFDASVEDPDDIGGLTGPTPVATAAVTQDVNGDYTYEVILSPGPYTVAFTCQASDDAADMDDVITFVQPTDVSVADGETPVVNF